MQDQTGGIWVSVNLRLRVGRRVVVTGIVGVSEGKVQIVPASSDDVKPLPGSEMRVATGRVGAATLGHLVTIEGTVTARGVVPDPPYGSKVFLDDSSGVAQVYLNASTDIDPKAPHFKPGRRLRVTGFGNQYQRTYEVDPRSRRDIRPLP